MAEIMVQHGRSQSFPNETCTDTHLLASCGKDSSRKFFWDSVGKKFRIGNACLIIENEDDSCRYAWMMLIWLEKKAEYGSHVVEFDEQTLILMIPHHFLTTYFRDALKVNGERNH